MLKNEQLTAIQRVHYGNNVFASLRMARSNLSMESYRLYRASLRVYFRKACRSGVSPPTVWHRLRNHGPTCCCSRIFVRVISLAYLDELYGECNGTARTCANSGYQTFFSQITEHLGTRLISVQTQDLYLVTVLVNPTPCQPRFPNRFPEEWLSSSSSLLQFL